MSWWRRKTKAAEDPTPQRPVFAAKRYNDTDPDLDARVETILAGLDLDAFALLREKHKDLPPYPGPGKYLEIATWLRRHMTHVKALGLLDGPPRRILDLGTGNGYFPFLCGRFGHEVVAFDLGDYALYNDLVDFLEVDRRKGAIVRYEPLPDLDGPFDLVTAFNICFNEQNSPTMWEPPEWEFFLRDVVDHQLAAGGEIFLKLNPLRKPGGYDEKPLLSWFESQGAELNVPFVHFPPGAAIYGPR